MATETSRIGAKLVKSFCLFCTLASIFRNYERRTPSPTYRPSDFATTRASVLFSRSEAPINSCYAKNKSGLFELVTVITLHAVAIALGDDLAMLISAPFSVAPGNTQFRHKHVLETIVQRCILLRSQTSLM